MISPRKIVGNPPRQRWKTCPSHDGSAAGRLLLVALVSSPMAISTGMYAPLDFLCRHVLNVLCYSVIGSVNTMLGIIYPTEYASSPARSNVSSIAFAGTVVGQLFFGWYSDHYSRKWALMISTVILILFAALGTGSYGAGGDVYGLFAALTAYRFLLGIGIG